MAADYKGHDFKLQRDALFGKVWICSRCKKMINDEDHNKLKWGEDVGLVKCRGGNYHLDTTKMKIVQHPNGYMFSVPASLSEQEVKDIIEATKGHGKVR